MHTPNKSFDRFNIRAFEPRTNFDNYVATISSN